MDFKRLFIYLFSLSGRMIHSFNKYLLDICHGPSIVPAPGDRAYSLSRKVNSKQKIHNTSGADKCIGKEQRRSESDGGECVISHGAQGDLSDKGSRHGF